MLTPDGQSAVPHVSLDRSDRLLEARNAHGCLVEGDVGRLVLRAQPACAQAELESTVGQEVERGRLLGEHRGVVVVNAEDAAADAQCGRRFGGHGHSGDGGQRLNRMVRLIDDLSRSDKVVGQVQRRVAELLYASGPLAPLG